MASYGAMAAVSRSLQALLADRMVTTQPFTVTLAPPDVTVAGIGTARVNLYLAHVQESAALRNQEPPGVGHPGNFGRPPLALGLKYILSTGSASETQADADLNAQSLLGDAMRVLHDYGGRLNALRMKRSVLGRVAGDPVLDPELTAEPDLMRVTLVPAPIDELTRFWSALGENAFRRSVMYDVEVVRIETLEPRVQARPVETRRISVGVGRPPELIDAMLTAGPGQPSGERRVSPGEPLTLTARGFAGTRLFVRLGGLDLIRVTPASEDSLVLDVPDDALPADADHADPRPIPEDQRLQPGTFAVELIAEVEREGVEGGLGAAAPVTATRRLRSNALVLQLVPRIDAIDPPSGGTGTVLTVTGARLWHPAARSLVAVGSALVAVRAPREGENWAAPTPTSVQVPIADALPFLEGPGPFAVAVEVDGARSRDSGLSFTRAG